MFILLSAQTDYRGILLPAFLGLATCVAPVLGGMLCSPAETWPSTFEGTIFEENPFFLPCLIVGTYGIAASVAMLLVLKEPYSGLSQPRNTKSRQLGIVSFSPLTTHGESAESPSEFNESFSDSSSVSSRKAQRTSKKSRFQVILEERNGLLRSKYDEVKEETNAAQEENDATNDDNTTACEDDTNLVLPFSIFEGSALTAVCAYGLLAVSQQMGDEVVFITVPGHPLVVTCANSFSPMPGTSVIYEALSQ